jgi:hypothetical protein
MKSVILGKENIPDHPSETQHKGHYPWHHSKQGLHLAALSHSRSLAVETHQSPILRRSSNLKSSSLKSLSTSERKTENVFNLEKVKTCKGETIIILIQLTFSPSVFSLVCLTGEQLLATSVHCLTMFLGACCTLFCGRLFLETETAAPWHMARRSSLWAGHGCAGAGAALATHCDRNCVAHGLSCRSLARGIRS